MLTITGYAQVSEVRSFQWGNGRTGYRARLTADGLTLPAVSFGPELRPGRAVLYGRMERSRNGGLEVVITGIEYLEPVPVPAPPEDEPPF